MGIITSAACVYPGLRRRMLCSQEEYVVAAVAVGVEDNMEEYDSTIESREGTVWC